MNAEPVTVTEYLDRPGGRVAYDVVGSGPLVLCVPGMGNSVRPTASPCRR